MLASQRIQVIFVDVSMLRIYYQQGYSQLRNANLNLETLTYRIHAIYIQKQKAHLHRIQLIVPPATGQG